MSIVPGDGSRRGIAPGTEHGPVTNENGGTPWQEWHFSEPARWAVAWPRA